MNLKHSILTTIVIALFLGCSKDDAPTQPQQSRTDLLVGKKWVMTSMTGKLANGSMVTEQIGLLPEYKKDDYWFFKPDLTFEFNDNSNKRPGSTISVLDQGTWRLVNGDSYIELKSNSPATSYFPTKVLEITSAQMKWESTDPADGTIIYTTYKPQ